MVERVAEETLTPVELDVGEKLTFVLHDGTIRQIVIRKAVAEAVRFDDDRVQSYRIACSLEIDGILVQLVRTIPSQENFRSPPTVMGLRIWLDAVADISSFLAEDHGPCLPSKQVRLALWDARARICPVLLHPWCPLPEGGLRIEDCYRGEDTWMGPYDGISAHGGLDINHPAGTPLWTPVPIDEHELFDRVDGGADNNRWRGLCHWPNGSTWILQSHHLIRLLVPEHQPISAGAHYAEGAGVLTGVTEHSHFVFGVRDGGDDIFLDPWLLFWQTYQDRQHTRQSGSP